MLDSNLNLTPKESQRFLSKVTVSGAAFCYRSLSYCHEWTAGKDTNGYGQFGLRGKNVNTHRMAWYLRYGAIPKGLCVLHRCDNRACCNPSHLWLGTKADNSHDMCKKERHGCGRGERQSWIMKKVAPRGDKHGARLHPESRPRGEKHGSAKLKDSDIPEIFQMRATGMTQREIAVVKGVARSQIGRVLGGKWGYQCHAVRC